MAGELCAGPYRPSGLDAAAMVRAPRAEKEWVGVGRDCADLRCALQAYGEGPERSRSGPGLFLYTPEVFLGVFFWFSLNPFSPISSVLKRRNTYRLGHFARAPTSTGTWYQGYTVHVLVPGQCSSLPVILPKFYHTLRVEGETFFSWYGTIALRLPIYSTFIAAGNNGENKTQGD